MACVHAEQPELSCQVWPGACRWLTRLPLPSVHTAQVVPKPSKEAQLEEPGAGRVFMSDVATKGKRPSFLNREVCVGGRTLPGRALCCQSSRLAGRADQRVCPPLLQKQALVRAIALGSKRD